MSEHATKMGMSLPGRSKSRFLVETRKIGGGPMWRYASLGGLDSLVLFKTHVLLSHIAIQTHIFLSFFILWNFLVKIPIHKLSFFYFFLKYFIIFLFILLALYSIEHYLCKNIFTLLFTLILFNLFINIYLIENYYYIYTYLVFKNELFFYFFFNLCCFF